MSRSPRTVVEFDPRHPVLVLADDEQDDGQDTEAAA